MNCTTQEPIFISCEVDTLNKDLTRFLNTLGLFLWLKKIIDLSLGFQIYFYSVVLNL